MKKYTWLLASVLLVGCSEQAEGTSIAHFHEKLLKLKDLMNTDEAKRIAEARHRFMEEFLQEFQEEWDGVD